MSPGVRLDRGAITRRPLALSRAGAPAGRVPNPSRLLLSGPLYCASGNTVFELLKKSNLLKCERGPVAALLAPGERLVVNVRRVRVRRICARVNNQPSVKSDKYGSRHSEWQPTSESPLRLKARLIGERQSGKLTTPVGCRALAGRPEKNRGRRASPKEMNSY